MTLGWTDSKESPVISSISYDSFSLTVIDLNTRLVSASGARSHRYADKPV
jgi:hypothetical protein